MNKNNTMDMKSILVTMSNIVSLCYGMKENGATNDQVMSTFESNVQGLEKELNDSKMSVYWDTMTAEDWIALGGMCADPVKGFYLLPPHIIRFLPKEFLLISFDSGEEEHVLVKDLHQDDIWTGIDEFGLTRFGVVAIREDSIESLSGLTFGKAFDILRNPENIDRIMRLPRWQPDVYIKVQWPDKDSKMTHPYLYVTSRFGCVPWKETVPELFSSDWEVYDEDIYLDLVKERERIRNEMIKKMQNNLDKVDIKDITKDLGIKGAGNVNEIRRTK